MLVIAALGALLHFLYELSGCNKVVAIFAAVNESTWEHIKICLMQRFCSDYTMVIFTAQTLIISSLNC